MKKSTGLGWENLTHRKADKWIKQNILEDLVDCGNWTRKNALARLDKISYSSQLKDTILGVEYQDGDKILTGDSLDSHFALLIGDIFDTLIEDEAAAKMRTYKDVLDFVVNFHSGNEKAFAQLMKSA
jgi:hypothetical protein